jgi:plasmid stabilization system protein ParE
MSYSLQIAEKVYADIWEGFMWYESQREGLGTEFRDYVYQHMENLRQAPFIYAPYRTRYRKMPLRRFPYSVIYQVMEAEQTVIVIAVLHQKQDSNLLFEE